MSISLCFTFLPLQQNIFFRSIIDFEIECDILNRCSSRKHVKMFPRPVLDNIIYYPEQRQVSIKMCQGRSNFSRQLDYISDVIKSDLSQLSFSSFGDSMTLATLKGMVNCIGFLSTSNAREVASSQAHKMLFNSKASAFCCPEEEKQDNSID